MQWFKENWLKIIVIILLFGALGNHSYTYYQILRWVVCFSSGYFAYLLYNEKNSLWVWIFGIIAVLFNPIAPIYFVRTTWSVIDVVVAVVYLISLQKKK